MAVVVRSFSRTNVPLRHDRAVFASADQLQVMFDLTLEIDVSSALEGVRHRGVAEICGRADAGDVLLGEDSGALGEEVVDVAVAAV